MKQNNQTYKNPLFQTWKNENSDFDDVIFEDSEGEYRYNSDKDTYEYYPDWLGYVQSENDFWETV